VNLQIVLICPTRPRRTPTSGGTLQVKFVDRSDLSYRYTRLLVLQPRQSLLFICFCRTSRASRDFVYHRDQQLRSPTIESWSEQYEIGVLVSESCM
jgi:hypothetical protein